MTAESRPSATTSDLRRHLQELAVHAIAGGVYELELQNGERVSTGGQYSDGIRKLLKAICREKINRSAENAEKTIFRFSPRPCA